MHLVTIHCVIKCVDIILCVGFQYKCIELIPSKFFHHVITQLCIYFLYNMDLKAFLKATVSSQLQMSATGQTTQHLGALYCNVVNSVYCCCVLPVNRAAPSHRLFVPLLITYLSKSEATVGHEGEKVSTWQTVNKGDSGRAGGEEAAGVKPC